MKPSYVTPDGYPLGKLVFKQRSHYKTGTLSAERIEFLKTFGDWSWEPRLDRWNLMFQKLQEYYRVNETTCVPQRYKTPDGYALGSWVNGQRNFYREGKLSAERIKLRRTWVTGAGWRPRSGVKVPDVGSARLHL